MSPSRPFLVRSGRIRNRGYTLAVAIGGGDLTTGTIPFRISRWQLAAAPRHC